MNLLWIKTAGLLPPDTGGKIRSLNILRHLAKQHCVTLFTFYAAHAGDVNPKMEQIVSRAVCVPLDMPESKTVGELTDYIAHAFSSQPYNLAKYSRPAVRRALENILKEQSYDAILCDFLAPAAIIPWSTPCPKVIFTHNVEAMIWKRHYDVARNPLWKLLALREWQTMERAERKYLGLADHVIAVSENDRNTFLSFLPSDKVTVVPTGVDVEYFKPSTEQIVPNSLVFTGSMDWTPNEDAVWYFCQEILPSIRSQIPNAKICIVGRNPSTRIQALASGNRGVEVTGWVEDTRPYLARSAVSVVPLRIGGGTRIKIYEAMAMGKAVVSTRIGAEGLPVIDGKNILLAGGAADFAASAVELLRNAERRDAIGQAAHDFVSARYSWSTAAQVFDNVLRGVAHSGSQPTLSSAV